MSRKGRRLPINDDEAEALAAQKKKKNGINDI